MNFSYDEAIQRGWLTKDDVPPASTTKRTKVKADIESKEQAEVIALFRHAYPKEGPLLIHIPNGGSRKNAFEGWRLKQQGVRAGVSDLFLPVAKGGYIGLWVEFKAARPNDAVVSDKQKEWLDLMREQGYYAQVCRGVTETMTLLANYLKETLS